GEDDEQSESNNEKGDKDKDEQIEDKNDNKTLPISRKRKLKPDTSSDQDDKIVDNSSTVMTVASTNVSSSSTIDQSNNIDDNNVKVDVMKVEEKKMVTIIKKGKAPVDEMFSMNKTTHVYADDQIVWDCLLNQTNVKGNNNKFYIIQLLESDSNSSYYVFNKWGRVGYTGQTSTSGPFSSLPLAQHEFQRKFRDKTGNMWIDVQDAIQMIFDINAFKNIMVELNYDASKLPLGKLSKNTITQGFQVLKRIEAVLVNIDQGNLEQLSNEFYTVIPHSFGMRTPPIISTLDLLKEKLDMVEALGEIEIAASLIKSADSKINLLDSHYNSLNLEKMEPLDHDSEEFKLILKYVKNTQGSTHYCKVEVLDVFSIERQGENERFSKYSNLHNRMLLWHGSRRTNFAGILSQGLRIAPPHVPSSGYMFGKG
ncbi:19643_t:CDS:2, partial [Dentiscutata erythropus]